MRPRFSNAASRKKGEGQSQRRVLTKTAVFKRERCSEKRQRERILRAVMSNLRDLIASPNDDDILYRVSREIRALIAIYILFLRPSREKRNSAAPDLSSRAPVASHQVRITAAKIATLKVKKVTYQEQRTFYTRTPQATQKRKHSCFESF